MGGLILFFVVGLWVVLVAWLSKVVATRIATERWRLPVGLLVFSVLAPMPILDELVGARQFERLCQENFTIKVDRATAVGRTVYLDQTPSFVAEGTWVPIIVQPWRYVDVTTGEIVLSYNTLRAKGGRLLKVSEGQVPMTFDGYCAPGGSRAFVSTVFRELRITQVQRSEINGVKQ